ncbi:MULTISPECIES: BTAD domain-containing putative transcriptional regulator [Streptomyces]|uniref:OmpR/PhoB-type domain-containing protein n=1 Tax=Streptomyces luteosporeus TaxID=173856 RepID=A0ABN3TJL6_9ACTN
MTLRFHVLGHVRADRDGQPLKLGSPQERAALALLLLRRGRTMSTPELIDALWGQDPPHRATDTLREYVTRLRAVIEPERAPRARAKVLVSTGAGYALHVPDDALDAALFDQRLAAAAQARAAGDLTGAHEHLAAALATWESGNALTGLPGPGVDRERERLRALHTGAREDLHDCAIALGRHTDAITGLRALATEHPLRERTRALLMLALHRAGRQAEALAVFTETARLLAEGGGPGPGPELVRLHEQVLAGDPALAPPRPGPVSPAPRHGADRLPPQPPCGFTGRDELAATIRAALTGDGARVVVLTGPGGAGKTALAVHVARALRARHPDGPLWADLRGTRALPPDAGAILAHLLHDLGVTDAALPHGTDRRAALLRSLLADRRTVLLLDDAHDEQQVLPLLPGAGGCAVLVTSRAPLQLPGAQTVEVGPLEEKDALRLLAAVSGSDTTGPPAPAAAVIAACEGLPLAVRIAGGRLAERSAWTLADVAARLGEERARLDHHGARAGAAEVAVEAALCVGYEALDRATAGALRLLCTPDADHADAAAAAALLGPREAPEAGAPEAGARAASGAAPLAGAPAGGAPAVAGGPVATPPAGGTPVAGATPTSGTPVVGAPPAAGMPGASTHVVGTAVGRAPTCGTPAAARHGVPEAAEAAGGEDAVEAAARVVASLVDSGLLEPLCSGRYRRHALVEDFVRRQSERSDSPALREAALLRLGGHQLATAVGALQRLRPGNVVPRHLLHEAAGGGLPLPGGAAVRRWVHEAQPQVLATVRQVLGTGTGAALPLAVDLLTVWGELAPAAGLEAPARQALERARRGGDDVCAARALRLVAAPRPGADTYERAERELRAALRWGEAAGDALAALLTGRQLALVLLELGRPEEALPLLVRAEERLREEGAQADAAEALAEAALAYVAVGRTEEALRAVDRATALAREAGGPGALARVLAESGRVHLRAGRSAAAADRMREALETAGPEGTDPRWEALVRARLAQCRLAQLRHREAIAAADAALAAEAVLGDAHVRALALAARGRAQLALGEPRLAWGALREAHELLTRRGAAEAAEVAVVLAEEFAAG